MDRIIHAYTMYGESNLLVLSLVELIDTKYTILSLQTQSDLDFSLYTSIEFVHFLLHLI